MEKMEITPQQKEELQIKAIKKASLSVSKMAGIHYQNQLDIAFSAIGNAIDAALFDVSALDIIAGKYQDNMFVANVLLQIKERLENFLCDKVPSVDTAS